MTDTPIQIRDSRGTYFVPSHFDCLHVTQKCYWPVPNTTITSAMATIRDLMLAGF